MSDSAGSWDSIEAVDLEQDDSFSFTRKRGGGADEAEMDITPMIDITFLLLIFFIIQSTPDNSTTVELPKATYGRGIAQLNSTIFTVGAGGIDAAPVYAADGTIGEPLATDPEKFREQIKEIVQLGLEDEQKSDVIIKADKGVAHREVAKVIKAISQVEGVQLHLGVLETKKK